MLELTRTDVSDLCNLQHEVDLILCAIAKVSTTRATRGIEVRMAGFIAKAWKSAANTALVSSLRKLRQGPINNTTISAFLGRIGVALKKPLTKRQVEIIGKQLEGIWKIAKRIGASEAKGRFIFGMTDRRAIAAISRHQVFWVGNFYSSQLSSRIRAVSREILLDEARTPAARYRVVNGAIKRELSLTPGGKTPFASQVPARYAGNTDLYFRGLASTASHQSRSFGRLSAYDDAGITSFRLTNPNDERTGQICQQMHGQTFTVQSGMAQMDRLLAARDPDDVKRIAPWLSGDKTAQVIGGARRGSTDATSRLEDAGVILPPFHMLCVAIGSPVLTARGWVPIEDVTVGDLVLTHKERFRRVTETMARSYTGRLTEIAGLLTAGLTDEHPVGIFDGRLRFIRADQLDSNDRILALGETARSCSPLLGSERAPAPVFESLALGIRRFQVVNLPVFNFEVEEDHTFVAGGVVVHNCRTELIVVT